jgi:exosortase
VNDAAPPGVIVRPSWRVTTPAERFAVGATLAVLAATAWYLLPFWREQPELSHGYFALPCALALLWQSRREHNWAGATLSSKYRIVQWALAVCAAVVGLIAALAALAQGPFHSQTAFLVGAGVSLFAISAITALSQTRTNWVRLNGASISAALLWWFVVPLPSGTLARFTLLLQNMITAGSLRALHIFGIPAVRHGNVIQMANTLVGVEEACSGIRSLTACLFAGVVLGGFMLAGFKRRVAIIVAAGIIAVVANFFRSTALCLMAARGIEINGFWHDMTAYAVLGATALVLFGGCQLLSRKRYDEAGTDDPRNIAASQPVPHLALSGLIAALASVVILKCIPPDGANQAPPDLRQLLVLNAPNWERHDDQSINAFSAALNTPFLHQETYLRGKTQVTFYMAYWPADQSTLGSVALHTPEICLPGSGWSALTAPAALNRYPLPQPQRFAFEKESYPQYVWFWHFFDGQLMARAENFYPWHLGPILLKRGIRARAPQWVIRVSSNEPLESLLNEPLLQEFFNRLRAKHLAGNSAE